MISFGGVIKSSRRENGLTQIELARKLKIDATYLSAIENGRRDPSLTLVKKIGHVLSIPPEVLFWESIKLDQSFSKSEKRAVETAKKILGHYLKAK